MLLWISTIFFILWGVIFASSVYAERSYQQGENNKRPGFIERLDQDNDGKVSSKEFDGPCNHFADFDKDGDGYIDESEKPTGPPPGKGNGMKGSPMTRLDKDGDGKVSQEEFPGPDNHFTRFDKDSDGYLSENELPKRRPGGNRQQESGQSNQMDMEKETE